EPPGQHEMVLVARMGVHAGAHPRLRLRLDDRDVARAPSIDPTCPAVRHLPPASVRGPDDLRLGRLVDEEPGDRHVEGGCQRRQVRGSRGTRRAARKWLNGVPAAGARPPPSASAFETPFASSLHTIPSQTANSRRSVFPYKTPSPAQPPPHNTPRTVGY